LTELPLIFPLAVSVWGRAWMGKPKYLNAEWISVALVADEGF
jgi:hypothetical protein